MPPSYRPVPIPQPGQPLTPEQQFAVEQFLREQNQRGARPRDLTYEEWLAQRGGKNPYVKPKQSGGGNNGVLGLAASIYAKNRGAQTAANAATTAPGLTSSAPNFTGAAGSRVAGTGARGSIDTLQASGLKTTADTPMFDIGSPSYAGYLAAAASLYNNARNFKDVPEDYKATKAQQAAALAVADVYTGGLASLAEGFARKQWGGTMAKLDKLDKNTNPLSLALGATVFHKSTKDYQKERTNKLRSQFQDDPTYQAYVTGMRDQTPIDPSKPFHGGEYSSWDEYKAAGLDAGDLTGVEGNISTFGKTWTDLTEDQRRAVTQALIDADLYASDKGDVVIKDRNQAKQIFDTTASGGFLIPKAAPQNNVQGSTPPRVSGGSLTPEQVKGSGAKSMSIPRAASSGEKAPSSSVNSMTGTARPWGYDEDPNHPGRYIKRK